MVTSPRVTRVVISPLGTKVASHRDTKVASHRVTVAHPRDIPGRHPDHKVEEGGRDIQTPPLSSHQVHRINHDKVHTVNDHG